MKNMIKRLRKRILLCIFRPLASCAKRFAAFAYAGLFHAEWDFDPPQNFDHELDVYYLWHKSCQSHWLERGVFSSLALQQFESPVAVELCCGEGFYDIYFYANSAKYIYACDIDEKAIRVASKRNRRDNVEFAVADIRNEIYPKRLYDTLGGGNKRHLGCCHSIFYGSGNRCHTEEYT